MAAEDPSARIPAHIHAEAAAWLARLRSDRLDPKDRNGFRQWLAEHPLNAAAFDHLNTVWDIAGGIRQEDFDEESSASTGMSRRMAIAMGAAVLATGTAGFYWSRRPVTYSTAVGEQRRIVLDDGSAVTLDTNSEIRVVMTDEHRHVEMVLGRAHFDVASDLMRPFVVQAGGRQVVALGTVFDVRQDTRGTAVVLFEGRVAVQPAGRSSLTDGTLLTPGDRMTVSSSGRMKRDRPDLQLAAAWQNGQAIFENETLAHAVDEMNRYSRRPLIIDSAALKTLRISGVYDARDAEGFARSVTSLLPASVEVLPNGITLSSVESPKKDST